MEFAVPMIFLQFVPDQQMLLSYLYHSVRWHYSEHVPLSVEYITTYPFVVPRPKNLTTSFSNLSDLFPSNCNISYSGMLSLLRFRPNFSEFSPIFVMEMSSLLFVTAENWFNETVSWLGMVITWSSTCLFVMPPLLSVSAENLFDECMSRSKMFITWSSTCLSITLFFLNSLFLLVCDPLGMLRKSFWFSISPWIIQVLFLFFDKGDESVPKVLWYI